MNVVITNALNTPTAMPKRMPIKIASMVGTPAFMAFAMMTPIIPTKLPTERSIYPAPRTNVKPRERMALVVT